MSEVVDCMEDLRQRGLILNWGVSNFDISDMKELFAVKNGNNCIVNQVLYHLGSVAALNIVCCPGCKNVKF